MAAKKWNIAALWALLETTFKTEPDASGATYKFLKATEITFQPMAEVIDRPAQTYDLVRQEHVIGAKGGKLAFKLELKASGTPAGSAVVAIAAEADPILQSYFGTVVRGTGVLTAAGGTTTSVSVTNSANFSKGMLIEVTGTGVGGANEQRFVSTIPDGTHMTVDRALTNAPGTGVAVYASSMYKRANSGHKSIAFCAKRDGIELTFLGCKVNSCKLEGVNAKGTALISVDVEVGTWSVTTKASLPSSDLSGITAVKAPIVKGSPLNIGGTTETVHGVDLDPGHSFVFQMSTEDVDAKAGMELVSAGPKGTIRPYYNAQHLTDFVAGTAKTPVSFICGDRTNGFGFSMLDVQWGQPAMNSKDGMVGEDLPFFANDPGTDPELTLCVF